MLESMFMVIGGGGEEGIGCVASGWAVAKREGFTDGSHRWM